MGFFNNSKLGYVFDLLRKKIEITLEFTFPMVENLLLPISQYFFKARHGVFERNFIDIPELPANSEFVSVEVSTGNYVN